MIAFVVKWTIKKGCEKKAIKGLKELVVHHGKVDG